MRRCTVALFRGQSLNLSDAQGGSGPFPDALCWDLQWNASTTFQPMSALTRTKDLAFAAAMIAAGRDVIVINLSLGGTSAAEWLPPSGSAWVQAEASLKAAMLLLPAALAGRHPDFILFPDQGEKNVSDAAGFAQALLWADNDAVTNAAIERIVGRKMERVYGLTRPQPSNFWWTEVHAEQLIAAGDLAHTIDRSDLALKVDGIHHVHPDSEVIYGQRQAAKALEFIPVSAILPAAASVAIDHARNKQAYTPAATHYAHAKVAGVYVSGGSYAPASNTNNKTTYGAASAGSLTNLVGWAFPSPTANWGAIDEIEISDSATPGAGLIMLRHTQLPAVTIGNTAGPGGTDTGPLIIPAGELDISLSGGFVVSECNALLDLMFGGTANTPRTTVFGSYFVGRPSAGGVTTSASRVSITQASKWAAAVNGVAATNGSIALADEPDADWYAEHTLVTGGTLIYEGQLPATPTAGLIPAGGLRTRIT